MRSDFGWRASRKQSTEIKDGNVVADVEDQIGMMLNHEHAGARLGDCQEQAPRRSISSAVRPAAGSSGNKKAGRSINARAISVNRSSLCCKRSARTIASPSSPTVAKASIAV